MSIAGIKIEWSHPIIMVMLITISLSVSVVASNPSIMRYTFHSAVDQPEWMRLSNYYKLVYSPEHDNWGGISDKWLEASNGAWFFVVPANELYVWDRSKKASGTLVASNLDPSFYQSPPTTFSNAANGDEEDTGIEAVGRLESNTVTQETSTVSSPYEMCTHCIHYDVVGTTGDEIIESMRAAAPVVDDEPMAGVTRFSWSYQANDCNSIGSAVITADMETSMPHWEGFSESAPSLQDIWIQFYGALLVHEEGHRQTLLDLIDDNEKTVKSAADCEDANQGLEDNHARYREIGLAYDQQTDHGRTQGADILFLRGK